MRAHLVSPRRFSTIAPGYSGPSGCGPACAGGSDLPRAGRGRSRRGRRRPDREGQRERRRGGGRDHARAAAPSLRRFRLPENGRPAVYARGGGWVCTPRPRVSATLGAAGVVLDWQLALCEESELPNGEDARGSRGRQRNGHPRRGSRAPAIALPLALGETAWTELREVAERRLSRRRFRDGKLARCCARWSCGRAGTPAHRPGCRLRVPSPRNTVPSPRWCAAPSAVKRCASAVWRIG